MKITDVLALFSGDENDQIYKGLAEKHHLSKKKKPVDISKLGTREEPISASLLPTLLGCEKRAFHNISNPKDLSKVEAIMKGNLSDDILFFLLQGVKEEVAKKFVGVAYPELATKKDTIITKSLKLVEYVKNRVFGEVMPEYMQLDLIGKIGKFYYSGHPDLVTRKDGILYVHDFKYSGRHTIALFVAYYVQLFMYAKLITLISGIECRVGGIISTNKILKSDKFSVNDFAASGVSSIGIEDIERRIESLLHISDNKPAIISMSDSCQFCRLCFENVKTKHESSAAISTSIKDLSPALTSVEPPKVIVAPTKQEAVIISNKDMRPTVAKLEPPKTILADRMVDEYDRATKPDKEPVKQEDSTGLLSLDLSALTKVYDKAIKREVKAQPVKQPQKPTNEKLAQEIYDNTVGRNNGLKPAVDTSKIECIPNTQIPLTETQKKVSTPDNPLKLTKVSW